MPSNGTRIVILPDGNSITVPVNVTNEEVAAKYSAWKRSQDAAKAEAAKAEADKSKAPADDQQSWLRTLTDLPGHAVAGFADMLGNLPTNVENLGRAAYGTFEGLTGHPERMPDVLPTPDVVRHMFERTGNWKGIGMPAIPSYGRGAQSPTQQAVTNYGSAALQALSGAPEASLSSLARAGATGLAAQGASDVAGTITRGTPYENAARVLAGSFAPGAGKAGEGVLAHVPGLDRILPSGRAANALHTAVGPDVASRMAQYQSTDTGPVLRTTAQEIPSAQTAAVEEWARGQARGGLFTLLDEHNQNAMRSMLMKAIDSGEDAHTVAGHVRSILASDDAMTAHSREAKEAAVQQAVRKVADAQQAIHDRVTPTGEGALDFGKNVQQSMRDAEKFTESKVEERTAPLRKLVTENSSHVDLGPVVASLQKEILANAGHESVVNALKRQLKNIEQFQLQGSDNYFSDTNNAWSVRKNIDDALNGKNDTPTDRLAAKELTKAKDVLDVQMNQATGNQWNTFLNAYKKEVRALDPFRNKIIAPLIERGEFGRGFAQSHAEVARALFKKDAEGAEAIRALRAARGHTLPTIAAFRSMVGDKLQTLRVNGELSARNLDTFVKQHAPALKAAGMYGELSNLHQARQLADEHLSTAKAEQDAFDKQVSGVERQEEQVDLRKLVGADQPQGVIASMLASTHGTERIAQLAKRAASSPTALNGLRRAVADALVPLEDRHTLTSTSKMYKLFQDKRVGLEKMGLYTPQQLDTLGSIVKQLRDQKLASSGAAQGERNMGAKMTDTLSALGNGVYSRALSLAMSAIGAHGFGGFATRFAGVEALQGAIRDASQQRIINAALDPSFAATLMKRYHPNRAKRLQPVMDRMAQQTAQAVLTMGQNQNQGVQP